MLRYRYPKEQAAPSDRRERVVNRRVSRVVHVIDRAHFRGPDQCRQKHQGGHGPACVEGCLKRSKITGAFVASVTRGQLARHHSLCSVYNLWVNSAAGIPRTHR